MVVVILLLRVWVLYSRSTKMGIFLGALFLIGGGIAFYLRVQKPDVSYYLHPSDPC